MLILFSTGVPAFVPFRVHFQYSLSCTEDLVRMYRSAVTFYLNFKISQRIFRKLLSVGVSCAQKTMLNANISVFQNFLQKSFVGKFWILAPPKILVPRRPCLRAEQCDWCLDRQLLVTMLLFSTGLKKLIQKRGMQLV